MKFLDDLIHKKIKPNFEKGGSLEKFYYAFEAGESFHFVTDKRTDTGAHVRDYVDLKRMMVTVILALIPCFFIGTWNVGYQQLWYANGGVAAPGIVESFLQGLGKVLPLMLTVYTTGGTIEAIISCIRKHEINEGFLVSGFLITLTLPPTMPLWQAAVGTAFGVFIGKEVFGGTGMNILNPALTARAFCFFAFAQQMSGDKVWVAPNEALVLNGVQLGETKATLMHEAVTMATPLGNAAKTGTEYIPSTFDMFLGIIPGSVGETSALACLLGAAYLIVTGVGSYRTMLGTLIGGAGITMLFNALPESAINHYPILGVSWIDHLVMGGFMFGLVFMCTDPVSSASTNIGKWIFGILTGILAMVIRCVNPAYPEGMMLAILFMNVFAPLIDHYVVGASVKRRLARG
ncbi:MAG: NADH:ubiquinone reductase (Na(+)-transporting) subunit B [Lentisphaerales bacterium]|nr:NADH:ubiquinone reductase (Na(+)-transporting) subunit B [Lentisphaerales bacterium]